MNLSQQHSMLKSGMAMELFNNNTAIVNSVTGLPVLVTALGAVIIKITSLLPTQQADKKSASINKNLLKEDAIDKGMYIIYEIESYCVNSNNNSLKNDIHFSKSTLKSLTESELRDTLTIVYTKANANLTALAAYNITAALLTAFKAAIDAFAATITKATKIGVDVAVATDNIADLFKQKNAIIRKIMILVRPLEKTQPLFYQTLKKTMALKMDRTSTTSLKVITIDSKTKKGLFNVALTYTLIPDEQSKAEITKSKPIIQKTTKSGKNRKIKLTKGNYEASGVLPGYKNVTTTFSVVDGTITELEIVLEKLE